jgi:hypothetical protein
MCLLADHSLFMISSKSLKLLARPKGFEPLTSAFGGSARQAPGVRFRSPYQAPQSIFAWENWSEWQDLNLRPPRPERGGA